MFVKCLYIRCLTTLLFILHCSISVGGNWPQWRYDSQRSGVSPDKLSLKMRQLWTLDLGRPAPAYMHQYRMCADVTYSPIAAEGLLFVPSNVSDSVAAFQMSIGEKKWSFITDGPVRYAPIYDNKKIYITSDDGYLYCLEASSGAQLWRVRGVPKQFNDSRMIVNGRMVSRWPSRGSAVLHGNTIFFGAGIWPEEGVFETAVNIETGKILWQTDSMAYIENGISDHGRPYDIGLPPNGYSAIIDGKLAVTCGRSLAAWFDLSTGEREPYTTYYVKHSVARGTSSIAGNDNFSVQGGNWFGTRADSLPPKSEKMIEPTGVLVTPSSIQTENEKYSVKNRPFAISDMNSKLHDENYYSDPIVTKDTLYASVFDDEHDYKIKRGHTSVRFPAFDKIIARDLTKVEWRLRKGDAQWLKTRKKKGLIKARYIEFPVKWEFKTSMKAMIKVGDYLVAGEKDKIALIQIPNESCEAKVVWEAKVDGIPVHTISADGFLVTVMDNGRIYSFGRGSKTSPSFPAHSMRVESPENGFALVVGWSGLEQVLSLVKDSKRRVIVLEHDEIKVQKARNALYGKGVYGRGVQVLSVNDSPVFSPYWANHIVVNDAGVFGSPRQTYQTTLDYMRPFSAEMHFNVPNSDSIIKELIRNRSDFTIKDEVVYRISAPEGAGEWTHESANSSNDFISDDKLVRWPLGLLWYSGDIDDFFSPASHYQHERNPYPLVKDGRMFIITANKVHAVDIYTGNYLWKAEFEFTPYLRSRLFDARHFGRAEDRNYVLADDLLYCITGQKIQALDVKSGKKKIIIDVPKKFLKEVKASLGSLDVTNSRKKRLNGKPVEPNPHWTEFRLWKNNLIALVGNRLIAIDRHSGKLQWSRKSTQKYITYSLGNDTIYAIDCTPEQILGQKKKVLRKALLVAIEPLTGKELWKKDYSYDSRAKAKLKNLRPWVKAPMPFIGYNRKHQLLVIMTNGNDLSVLKAEDGSIVWEKKGAKVNHKKHTYSPLIMDDKIVLSNYQRNHGVVIDLLTGERAGTDNKIPFVRACARLMGNENIMVTRDATTLVYDFESGKNRHFNSLRAGCTNNYVPAGGVLTAPMLAHGCVCNYPMFISLAMHYLPESDVWRPKIVRDAWNKKPVSRFSSRKKRKNKSKKKKM